MIHPADRVIASTSFRVAVGLVERNDPSPSIRELALDALRMPTPPTIRALISVGRGRPWMPSVIDALATVGIAAAVDVLADDPPQLADGPRRWELQHDIYDLVDGMDVERLERVLVVVKEIVR